MSTDYCGRATIPTPGRPHPHGWIACAIATNTAKFHHMIMGGAPRWVVWIDATYDASSKVHGHHVIFIRIPSTRWPLVDVWVQFSSVILER